MAVTCLSDAKGPADALVGVRGTGGQVRSTFSAPTNMKTVACLADVKGTGDAPVGERVNEVLVVRFILYCTGWQWLGQVNRALLKNVDFFMEGFSGGKV